MHSEVHGLQSPLFEYDRTKIRVLLEAGHGVPSNITRCASLWFLALQGTRANKPFPQKKAHTTSAHANKRVCVRLSPATNLASTGRHPIIKHTMSIRLVEGTSDGCRPKLHRWPFSVLSLILQSVFL